MSTINQGTNKPFLITGFPRSGTYYTTTVFKSLGYDVLHEREGLDGVVSYKHINTYLDAMACCKIVKYSPIIHQVRDPLKVLNTVKKISFAGWKNIYRNIHSYVPQDLIERSLVGWLHFNRFIERHAIYRFKIEDLGSTYPELFDVLGLPIPSRLPAISKEINTRKDTEYYEEVSLESLKETYPELMGEVLDLANKYGYRYTK
jgi:hypothetical protein